MVKYNYTNKTNSNEVPQQVQNNAIMLKQNDQQLSPTTATGDNASLINSTNNGQVLPGKSFDGALLVKVNDTTSEVTMYFKNIQTNAWLDSTQPLITNPEQSIPLLRSVPPYTYLLPTNCKAYEITSLLPV